MADMTDMAAVGNVARVKKDGGGGGPLKLKSFTVDFSDNGGATIREIRERQVPEGRRASSSFPMGSDVKENTFEDMGRARAHIDTLLGGGGAPAAPVRPPAPPPAMRPPIAPPMRPQPIPPPGVGGGGGGGELI